MTGRLSILCSTRLACSVIASTVAANVIVGGTGGDNLFPFGTVNRTGAYSVEDQQVYSAAAFPSTNTRSSVTPAPDLRHVFRSGLSENGAARPSLHP
jgi:hypothetical protein